MRQRKGLEEGRPQGGRGTALGLASQPAIFKGSGSAGTLALDF